MNSKENNLRFKIQFCQTNIKYLANLPLTEQTIQSMITNIDAIDSAEQELLVLDRIN